MAELLKILIFKGSAICLLSSNFSLLKNKCSTYMKEFHTGMLHLANLFCIILRDKMHKLHNNSVWHVHMTITGNTFLELLWYFCCIIKSYVLQCTIYFYTG